MLQIHAEVLGREKKESKRELGKSATYLQPEKTQPREQTADKLESESARPSNNETNSASQRQTSNTSIPVKALVSSHAALSKDMLTKEVLIAGQIINAHLDTCATHCFVSTSMSKMLEKRGYAPIISDVRYSVEQGNPLCITSMVHVLPLTMACHQVAGQAAWEAILFIVADCGADVIICYQILKLGGIVDYDPPMGYLSSLRENARNHVATPAFLATAQRILLQGRRYEYTGPSRIPLTNNKKRVHFPDIPILGVPVENENCSSLRTESKNVPSTTTGKNHSKLKTPTLTALTEAEPYGKNPPLPEIVVEALTLLKNLAEDSSASYTAAQLREVQDKLKEKRPQWATCLTMQHLEEISDKPTEQFISDMMDKPRWQKSIFQTAMLLETTCDFKEFEINQRPGRDMWNAPQPKLYRSPAAAQITNEWLDTLLSNRKCRESNATHPAPVTIVERPPRDPRVCINYINRNHRTEIPVYPMPDVWDYLEEATGYEHYCSFDMAKMFTQFRIKEEHKHLAAFITPRGVFEPNVIMFGLGGAPQHAVREVGGGMAKDPRTNGVAFTAWATERNNVGETPPYEICPITKIVKGSNLRPFVDDVFIRSNHTEGMKKLTELFFEFCEAHSLILNRKKAIIMRKSLKTLGFVISKEGKHLDPGRIISLIEMPLPRSKETLHSMLSSYTFVRMFIPNFALIASPLYEATRGIVWKGPQSGKAQGIKIVDPDFIWTEAMTRAYEQLRTALLDAPILSSPDWNFPLFLSVDASMRGEGWVLWQMITTSDGRKIAVAILYGSRKYSDTERKWETTRQEATAIKSALNDVAEYVFGQHFYLFSDHLNLCFMQNSINRAVLRMRDFLSQFNMTVVHCPGAWNNADAVSRLEIEKLPTELATNLNSSTQAKLSESGLSRSIGTCTSMDLSNEDDVTLPLSDHPHIQIHVLRTETIGQSCHCHNMQDYTCFLCSINEDFDLEESDYTDEKIVESLKTNASENPSSSWKEDGLEPIIHQILLSSGSAFKLVDMDSVFDAANDWNRSKCNYPSEIDDSLPMDEDDKEDLDWCEPPDRTALVLLARNRSSESKSEIRIRVVEDTPLVNHRINKFRELSRVAQINELTLHEEELAKDLEEIVNTTLQGIENIAKSWVGCNSRRTTQTTPADFRTSQIHTPMKNDFTAIHNDASGHHGLEYSYRKLLKRCGSKWANERGEATKVKDLLKLYIEGCPICQKLRGLREKIKCKHSFIVSRPFLETSYDFVIFKRPDKNGNRYLLVAICNFLKLVELKPVEHRDAETVAKFLLEIASRYGHCARLRSDREAAFIGQIITRLNENRGTETTPCIAYHPEANSICERQNGIVMFHLTALVMGCNLGSKTKVAWSDLIPMVFSIVNNTPKNPLGISPLSLVYGVFANYDRPLLDSTSANREGAISNPIDYVDSLFEWQNRLLEITEDIQSQHFQKLHKRLNSTENQRRFDVGDFVLQQKDATGISGKPSGRWIGPFLVMDRRDNDPEHPVLDLMNLTDMTVKEASIQDCRQFNTSWFDEDTMIPELTKIAAADLDEYVVEKIISHRPAGETRTQPLSKYFFQVKWEDFAEPTWEPYSGIKNLEPMDTYSDDHPNLKIPKSSST